MPLLSYQEPLAEKHLKALADHRLAIGCECTGSGKTFIVCDVARRRGRPLLVIAPKAVHTQWRRAAEAMGAGGLLLDVTNPEQISKPRGCRWYNRRDMWKLPPGGADVVFDEIHRGASGATSITTEAVARLRAYGTATLTALSATVAVDPLKLRALAYWRGLCGYAEHEYYRWCRQYGCTEVSFGDTGRSAFMFTRNKTAAGAYMREIRGQFGDTFITANAEDIPGFPEEVVQTRLVDLPAEGTAEIAKAYEAMSERVRAHGRDEMSETVKERQRVEFLLADSLASMAADSVEDGNSAVVYVSFTEPRERVVRMLLERGISDITEVYGSQKEAERQRGIDLFQANVNRVAVVNLAAGGCGLSLHDERHERMRESFLVPSFSASEFRQALGRTRRAGGTKAVQNVVIAAGTVMERVGQSVQRKLGNLDALLDSDFVPA